MIASLVRHFDDRINPIVVKELRQAVAGRFVAAVLVLFLLISLVVLGGFLLFGELDSGSNFEAGRYAMYFFQGVLVSVCMMFLPVYTGIRMAVERSDTNTDLMFITTIPPRAVVWGKLLAALILALVIYSACMPFMTLTYLMRGVDLPSIFLVLALGFGVLLIAIMLGLFVACLTTSLAARILLGLGLLNVLITMVSYTIMGSVGLVEMGLASRMNDWEFWGPALTIIAFGALHLGLLFFWSVALIKPPSANRAMPVRLYMTGMWAASLLIMGIWYYYENEEELIFMWSSYGVFLAALGMAIATSERESWGQRIRRTIPRTGLSRLGALLLYSGSAGGMLWASLLAAATLGVYLVGWAYDGRNTNDFEYFFQTLVGMVGYAFAYCMTAIFIRRYLLARLIRKSHTWVIGLLLLAVGILVPFLAQLILGYAFHDAEAVVFWLTSPFGLGDRDYRFACCVASAVWACGIALLSLPWFVEQTRNFRRLD